jgi:hypothetical protein
LASTRGCGPPERLSCGAGSKRAVKRLRESWSKGMTDASELQQLDLELIAQKVSSLLIERLNADAKDADRVLDLLHTVMLTRDQAARFLGVAPKTITSWCQDGLIPYRRVCKEYRFLLSELLVWSLPQNDPFPECRLSTLGLGKIAEAKKSDRRS